MLRDVSFRVSPFVFSTRRALYQAEDGAHVLLMPGILTLDDGTLPLSLQTRPFDVENIPMHLEELLLKHRFVPPGGFVQQLSQIRCCCDSHVDGRRPPLFSFAVATQVQAGLQTPHGLPVYFFNDRQRSHRRVVVADRLLRSYSGINQLRVELFSLPYS